MSVDEVKSTETIYDVIIIGAGYSGLSAGLYFKDCNVDNFLVLEARNRVGGRVCTEYVKLDNGSTCYVDAGGAYIGPTQNRLLRMCNRFGIKTFKVNMKGQSILNYNNRLSYYSGTIPTNMGIFALLDLNSCIIETDKLAKHINTKDINQSNISKQLLQKYDSMTLQEWFDKTTSDTEAKQQMMAAVRSILCVEACEISLLFWLNYVANANKSIMHLIETENGGQDSKIVGGSEGVCQAIQKNINKHVKLSHIVTRIEDNKDYVVVECENGLLFKTKCILCCIAPTLYNKIKFEPDLCWRRQSICNRMPMGFIIKTNTYFKTAWWRNNGFNGFSFNVNDDEINKNPVIVTLDDCKPDGSYPSLMGFILANQARKYMEMGYEERKQCVLAQYEKIFGTECAVTECIGYFEKIWHDEQFSGGCYVGTVGCNVMSSAYWKILKKAENNKIYFAGTELADNWMGYMDGAIQAGEREANKIANILAKNNKKIKIKKIFEADKEPECENCPLPYVNIERSWIETNILPNARNAKIYLIVITSIVIVGGLYIAAILR